jgi:hypothetical protein
VRRQMPELWRAKPSARRSTPSPRRTAPEARRKRSPGTSMEALEARGASIGTTFRSIGAPTAALGTSRHLFRGTERGDRRHERGAARYLWVDRHSPRRSRHTERADRRSSRVFRGNLHVARHRERLSAPSVRRSPRGERHASRGDRGNRRLLPGDARRSGVAPGARSVARKNARLAGRRARPKRNRRDRGNLSPRRA